MILPITALTAAVLAIMVLATAISTVRERFRGRVAFGDGQVDALIKAMRAHGNLTEHAPMAVIMIGLLELSSANATALWVVAIALLIARAAHIVGLHTQSDPAKPPLGRSLGVIGTWVIYAVLIGWILARLLGVDF